MLTVDASVPTGPPPTVPTGPAIVQRRVSNTGGISICGQRTWLGREHARKTVAVHVADEMLTIRRRTTHRSAHYQQARRRRQRTRIPQGQLNPLGHT